ncbi:MAG: hypothetical protein H0X66_05600 [Verrucomicrobia bacterium]|nr:hypothetical protein [Verrucomicrobiota bacterium]
MKRLLLCSLVVLLAGTAFARWVLIPTEKLLTETDLVVVARLSDVTRTTKKDVDHGSGILTVSEVLKGPATPGQKLTLEWANQQRISRRIDHADQSGKTNIWLLQKTTNGTFTANYPGRVLDLEQREEVRNLLKKR